MYFGEIWFCVTEKFLDRFICLSELTNEVEEYKLLKHLTGMAAEI